MGIPTSRTNSGRIKLEEAPVSNKISIVFRLRRPRSGRFFLMTPMAQHLLLSEYPPRLLKSILSGQFPCLRLWFFRVSYEGIFTTEAQSSLSSEYFFNQKLFPPRPQRLRGEKSEYGYTAEAQSSQSDSNDRNFYLFTLFSASPFSFPSSPTPSRRSPPCLCLPFWSECNES